MRVHDLVYSKLRECEGVFNLMQAIIKLDICSRALFNFKEYMKHIIMIKRVASLHY